MKLTLTNIDYLIRAEQIRKHKEVKDFQWWYATLRKLLFGKKLWFNKAEMRKDIFYTK